MKSRSFGPCGAFGLALLALSFSFQGSAVRAENQEASWQDTVLEPFTKLVAGLEGRLANLETTVIGFAGSFSTEHLKSDRVTTKELCVADDTGAATCISKAQLDALLRLQVQLGEAPAAHPVVAAVAPKATVVEPAVNAVEPTVEAGAPAVEAVTPAVEAAIPPALEPVAAIAVEVTVT